METLPAKLFLLALDGRRGRPVASSAIGYGLAGAALVELVRTGRLSATDGRLQVRDPGPTGDETLDVVVARLAGRSRPMLWRHAVQLLARSVGRQVPGQLIGQGVLVPREGGLLRRRRYAATDPGRIDALRAGVRSAVTTDVATPDLSPALAALAAATGILPSLVGRRASRAAGRRALRLAGDAEPAARAVARAVQAAASSAAVAGAVAATSASV